MTEEERRRFTAIVNKETGVPTLRFIIAVLLIVITVALIVVTSNALSTKKLTDIAESNRATLKAAQHSIECVAILVFPTNHPVMCEDVRQRIEQLNPGVPYPPTPTTTTTTLRST